MRIATIAWGSPLLPKGLGVLREGSVCAMGNRKGFTLVEIMVTIGVFGLLTVMAIPAVNNYVRSNRLATTTDQMAADLQMIRTMSIANGRIYRMTATNAGYTVTDPVSGEVIRDRDFHSSVGLTADATVNFFPWGMADAQIIVLTGDSGNRTIQVLPTGTVEVH